MSVPNPTSNIHAAQPASYWRSLGYNSWVAEALEGRELSMLAVSNMSAMELFDETLEWHGIIGFSSTIADALDNLRNMEAL